MAVDEAVSNAIQHAYPAVELSVSEPNPATAAEASASDVVELTLWIVPDAPYIEIVDHGIWREPTRPPSRRGLGIPLMQRLVETVLIHYDPRGTRVMPRHRLPGEAMPAPDAAAAPLTPGLE